MTALLMGYETRTWEQKIDALDAGTTVEYI